MALLRRKKKDEGQRLEPSANGGPAPAATTDAPPPDAAPPAEPPRAAKPPKAERRRVAVGAGGGPPSSLFDLSDRMPSREEMEREAAAELEAAVAPSWNRLMAEVPDAGSPVEAERKIESRLGPFEPDKDAALPSHPIYQGDALVYYQLRRHYGSPNPGGSFWRSWFPGR